jgi:hypothetical protein
MVTENFAMEYLGLLPTFNQPPYNSKTKENRLLIQMTLVTFIQKSHWMRLKISDWTADYRSI